jgi:urate oxidase
VPVLGPHQYGKAETRVVRVTREGATHHVRDLNVSVSLTGHMDEAHLSGSNKAVLPTDTVKNTVFAFAREHGIDSPEHFGIRLARHFVGSQPTVTGARVSLEEYAWDRVPTPGEDAHSFVRDGRQVRTARVAFDDGTPRVLAGLTGLTVMNTTDSEFWGYLKDRYTTLQETRDRILATEVNALWRHSWAQDEEPDWDGSHAAVTGHLLDAFAGSYSYSLQQTLYQMGARVIEHRPEIDEIRLSLPNKHHFAVDLTPFSMTNEGPDGAVYLAADRPYGLIEATVLREGARAAIPAELTGR